jgi:hypothetical protein
MKRTKLKMKWRNGGMGLLLAFIKQRDVIAQERGGGEDLSEFLFILFFNKNR